MTIRPIVLICAVASATAFAACDTTATTRLSSFGGNSVNGGTGSALVVTPSDVQLRAGTTSQLSTNAGTSSSQLQWLSNATSVASVSSSGLVTATATGTATITVRFASDTTNSTTATITVTP